MEVSPEMEARILALTVDTFDGEDTVRDVFKPRTKMTVSEWAYDTVRLARKTNAEPGRYDVRRTPYMREPLDSFADVGIQQITFMKSTQVGGTEAMLVMLAYAIDQDPAPLLFVEPIEDLAGEISEERIKPLLKGSPKLRKHIPKSPQKFSKYRYQLSRMDVHMAWAGSAAKLASKPKRYLFCDESAKYPPASGKEGDPIKLGMERQRTFWNRKTVQVSTPVVAEDNIDQAWRVSDQRRYYVPCPECGEWFYLKFEMVGWPKEAPREKILDDGLAYYECEHCNAHINDQTKTEILQHGLWCPADCQIVEGAVVGEQHSRHRGYHINALYSPWLTFSEIAYEFLTSKGNRKKLQNFVNSWLGEPWVDRARDMAEHKFLESCQGYTRGTIPDDVMVLTAGVDVQESGVYFYVAGFSNDREQYLIDYDFIKRDKGSEPRASGLDSDLDDLEQIICKSTFERSDKHPAMQVRLCAIDSRWRGAAVKKLARRNPQRIRMIKGSPRQQIHVWRLYAAEQDRGGKPRKHGLKYAMLDTNTLKDMVADLFESDPPKWHFPEDVEKTFMRQFLAEAKVVIGRDAAGTERTTWKVKPGQRDNHYWDTGVYALAAAEMIGVGAVRYEAELRIRKRRQAPVKTGSKITTKY